METTMDATTLDQAGSAELAQKQQGGGEFESLDLAQRITALARRREGVLAAVKQLMVEDVDYGKIPGCGDDKVLLQPGAQKLAHLFQLVPLVVRQEMRDLGDGHREYEFQLNLLHRGDVKSTGTGSCSTMEGKYRYRWQNTDQHVPREYWENGRDPLILGGPQYAARKAWNDEVKKKTWYIFEKVEHTDPADYYNTVLKMAYKRALVHAVIQAVAASDLFTQDVDDMDEEATADRRQGGDERGRSGDTRREPARERMRPQQRQQSNGQTGQPQNNHSTAKPAGPGNGPAGPVISEGQERRLWAIAKEHNRSGDDVEALLAEYGIDSAAQTPREYYEEIIARLEGVAV